MAEPTTEAGRALLHGCYRTSPETAGMDDPRYATYLAGRQRMLDAILAIEAAADSRLLVMARAVVALADGADHLWSTNPHAAGQRPLHAAREVHADTIADARALTAASEGGRGTEGLADRGEGT